jgi:glycerophosphoryl diester phosphodiesterase
LVEAQEALNHTGRTICPTLLAHRGSETECVENTMEAFSWAVDHGAKWIETDVHITRDNHLVCVHDPTLDRATTEIGLVRDHRLEEVRSLGVACLAEAFDAFPDVSFNVDLKPRHPEVAAIMWRLVLDRSLQSRCRVASFHTRVIRAFRRMSGGSVRTAASPAEVAVAWAASRFSYRVPRTPYDAFQVPVHRGVTVIDRRFIDTAHRSGKEVHVWTIDDRDEARRLVDMGVDGIITNRIDLLLPMFY